MIALDATYPFGLSFFWCQKFGRTFANELRRRRPWPWDKWHPDEGFVKINGQTRDLWRAVDQDGMVLDSLVQTRRDKAAAKRFFRKLPERFLSTHDIIVSYFRPSRHRLPVPVYGQELA